jgi:hypothetical protein
MMRLKPCVLFIILLCFQWLKAENASSEVVAYVGHEVITRRELQEAVNYSPDAITLKRQFQGEHLARRWKNLEKIILEEQITRKLIAREARKFISYIDPEEVETRIAATVYRRGLKNRDELKALLHEEGLSWQEWRRALEDDVYIEYYSSYVTRRQYLIRPEEARKFYEQHKHQVKEEHRSVDGKIRRVLFKTPDVLLVNHLYLKPAPFIKTIEALSKAHALIRVLVMEFKNLDKKNLKAWIEKTRLEHKNVEIAFIEKQECLFGAGTLGTLEEEAFQSDLGTWSRMHLSREATNFQNIQIERWDAIEVISKKKGKQLAFREIRDQILLYLRQSIRDREMKILKDRLWKTGYVKIVG